MNKHETARQLALLERIADDLATLVAALAPPKPGVLDALMARSLTAEAEASVALDKEMDHLRHRQRDEHGRFLPRGGVDGS